MNEKWVALYSPDQGAYHLETLAEYKRKPFNGYRILAIKNTRKEASDVIRQCRAVAR